MYKIITYNKENINWKDEFDDKNLKNDNYNTWIDVKDPTHEEISWIQKTFHIDKDIVNQYFNGSKKPRIQILENYKFTIMLNIRFKTLELLETEAVYILVGNNWLITIHSSKIDLIEKIQIMFKNDKTISESSIDILYYSILSKIVEEYEHVLTAIEIAMTDFEEKSLYNPSRDILIKLEGLARKLIILRRHFWRVREIFNFLLNTRQKYYREEKYELLQQKQQKENEDDLKYLKIVYDNVNQLVDLIESHKDTINSIRELYIAYISLHMNDSIKTLTIFTAILLPLTFITSVFGMNGLDLKNIATIPSGFIIVLIIMGLTLVILFAIFKKKQWISKVDYYEIERIHKKRKREN